jgi:hypothetical protein
VSEVSYFDEDLYMRTGSKLLHQLLFVAAGIMLVCLPASATENGATVWPRGAESIVIATAPRPGQTNVYEYTCFYEANQLDDANGKKLPIPDFRLRVFAVAVKVAHNWGVKFAGGNVVSWIAVPTVYEQIHVPLEGSAYKYRKDGISNVNLVPIRVNYSKGIARWFWELQFETTGDGYDKDSPINIGQHNLAFTPAVGFTLFPNHGKEEISSRFDYIINDQNHDNHYHSGNEFLWQFDARQEIPNHKSSVGLVGYFHKQITDDHQNGAIVTTTNADGTLCKGYKGRVLSIGPQVTFPIGKLGGMAFKWDHDLLVQNQTRGNAFWFQFMVPFSYLHHLPSEHK